MSSCSHIWVVFTYALNGEGSKHCKACGEFLGLVEHREAYRFKSILKQIYKLSGQVNKADFAYAFALKGRDSLSYIEHVRINEILRKNQTMISPQIEIERIAEQLKFEKKENIDKLRFDAWCLYYDNKEAAKEILNRYQLRCKK